MVQLNKLERTMKILMVLAITVLGISCGRRDTNECRNKESMRMECQVVNTPTYGGQYARELCARNYSTERCY
jgi:hypothetical protein